MNWRAAGRAGAVEGRKREARGEQVEQAASSRGARAGDVLAAFVYSFPIR